MDSRYSTRDLTWSLDRGPPAECTNPGMDVRGIPLEMAFFSSRPEFRAMACRFPAITLCEPGGGSWQIAQTASYSSFPFFPPAGREWHWEQEPEKRASPGAMGGC